MTQIGPLNCILTSVQDTLLSRFSISTLWCSHVGNHPHEDLAKFGYKLNMKVKKKKESFFVLATTYYKLL